jgi:PAS domain S-box-containing protein
MRKDRTWTEPVVEGLQLVAQIFANALARKRSDEALRESEARLASAVDIARLGFYEATRDRQVTFLDNRVRDLLAIPEGQDHLTLDYWAKRLDPRDRDRVLHFHGQILIGEGRPVAEEYRYQHPERGLLWLNHLLNVVEWDDAGQPVRWIGVLRDITELKKAEEELTGLRLHSWHSGRVTQIGAITASLAHELNQPLAAILTNAQAGLRFMDHADFDVEEIRAILTDIIHDDKRAAMVISGLRSMLRRREIPRETISLAEEIRMILNLVHSEMLGLQVDLRLRLDSDCMVSANRAQIQQVLLNLFMNALQAMQDEPAGQRNLEITLTSTAAGEAMLAVRDSGPGIPEEMHASVFEAFWTTKPEGLGIGLAICRSIVESHGGRLWLTANPDRGTTFHIAVPLAADPDPTRAPARA